MGGQFPNAKTMGVFKNPIFYGGKIPGIPAKWNCPNSSENMGDGGHLAAALKGEKCPVSGHNAVL